MKRLLWGYAVATLLLYACSSSQSPELLRPECHQALPKMGYKIEEEATIHIPDSNPTSHSKRLVYGEDSLYIYLGKREECLYVHDMHSGVFLHEICIDDLRHKKIKDFYIHNLDSIFISLSDLEVGLINGEGTLTNKWKLADYKGTGATVPDYSLNSGRRSLYFDNGYLHLTLNPTDLWYKRPSDRPPFGLAIDVMSGEQKLYGSYYGIYDQDTKGRELPTARSYPYLSFHKDKVLVSLPFAHEASIFNWKKGLQETRFCATSNYLSRFAPLMPPEYDLQTSIHFQLQNGYYGPLIYHEGIQVYTRQVEHSMPLYKPDGRLESPVNRPRSLIVLDSSLQPLGEIMWPDNYLFDERAQPTEDGFWVIISKTGKENEVKLLKISLEL